MSKKRYRLPQSVVEAARQRIITTFDQGVRVYVSISGGKDSIVLSHLVLSLIEEGKIDPSRLTVTFIDEEAMFDDVIEIVKKWRRRFLAAGARFEWYCLEIKHYNCFNQLAHDESFICWDSTVPETWVHPIPSFAITDHPKLKRRVHRYQEFLDLRCTDGIRITGVRVAESVQRLNYFKMRRQESTPVHQRFMHAIFDWSDPDVWRYIREHELDFPATYMNLYQIGRSRREMRISQFFSIDTAKSLVRLGEHDPGLMERVIRREPNAYLAAMYWDTEMFRHSGGKGEASHYAEGEEPETGEDGEPLPADVSGGYRAKLLAETVRLMTTGDKEQRRIGRYLRQIMLRFALVADERDWRTAYSIALSGDPKNRNIRALSVGLQSKLKLQESAS